MPLTATVLLGTSRLCSISIKSKTTLDLLAIGFKTCRWCKIKLKTKSHELDRKRSSSKNLGKSDRKQKRNRWRNFLTIRWWKGWRGKIANKKDLSNDNWIERWVSKSSQGNLSPHRSQNSKVWPTCSNIRKISKLKMKRNVFELCNLGMKWKVHRQVRFFRLEGLRKK